MDPAALQYFESLSYFGIFFAIALSGHVIPMPEEVILLIVGFIAASGIVKLPLAILVSVIGILVADIGFYFLSAEGAKLAVHFKSKIKTDIFDWYASHMKERTFLVMFLSRFVPVLRVVSPLVAGAVRINPPRFILFSFLSALVYVPIIVLIGFFFQSKITPLISAAQTTRHFLFLGLLVVTGVAVALVAKKKFFT